MLIQNSGGGDSWVFRIWRRGGGHEKRNIEFRLLREGVLVPQNLGEGGAQKFPPVTPVHLQKMEQP